MKLIYSIFFIFIFTASVWAQDYSAYWTPYLSEIETNVKAKWYDNSKLNKYTDPCSVKVFFSIHKDGKAYQEKIAETNCPKDINNIALTSIKSTSPFKPFPAEIKGIDDIDIVYVFNYKHIGNISQDVKKEVVEDKSPQSVQNNDKQISTPVKVDDNSLTTAKGINKKLILGILAGVFLALLSLAVLVFVACRKFCKKVK